MLHNIIYLIIGAVLGVLSFIIIENIIFDLKSKKRQKLTFYKKES